MLACICARVCVHVQYKCYFNLNRLNYASGRDGLLPKCLGSIHVHYKTPIPALMYYVRDNAWIKAHGLTCLLFIPGTESAWYEQYIYVSVF